MNEKNHLLTSKNETKRNLETSINQVLINNNIEQHLNHDKSQKEKHIKDTCANQKTFLVELMQEKISKELEIKIYSEMAKNLLNAQESNTDLDCFVCENEILTKDITGLKNKMEYKIEKLSHDITNLNNIYNMKNSVYNE